MKKQPSIHFESLEQRTLLAGDVTVQVVGGVLEIDGDKLDNVIDISQLDSDSFQIIGIGTRVNGTGSFTADGVRSGFDIGLGSGNDRLRILGSVQVPGSLTIKAGNGDDVIEPAGMQVHGDTLFNLGRGNDQVRVTGCRFDGRAEFWFKHGDDLARIEDSTVLDFFEFDMGENNDTVQVVRSIFEGPSKIDSSDGEDSVTVDGATMKGSHEFVAKGPGFRTYEIANSTFQGDTSFATGVGDEQVAIDGSRFDRRLDGKFDSGSDTVQLSDSSFHGSVRLDGDDGDDSATFRNAGNTFLPGQPKFRRFEKLD